MEDFSLYMLDITMNSVRAGATEISVRLEEADGILTFTVADNGCGMSEEQLRKLSDPFFTTRTTRAVGLGVPLFRMLAEQTGGNLTVTSREASRFPDNHGTTLTATFHTDHVDFIPLGDIVGTVVTLIQGSPAVNFTFDHITPNGTVHLACSELRAVLGEDIPLSEPEILAWIRDDLNEGYAALAK